MQKSLSFNKGITTSPSDLLSDDTELSASRDLIFRNGEIQPLRQAATFGQTDHKLLYIHKGADYANAITYDGTNLYWGALDTENGSISKNEDKFSVGTVSDISSVGNTLVVATDNGLHYILFKEGSYVDLGTELPTYRFDPQFPAATNEELGETTPCVMDGLVDVGYYNANYHSDGTFSYSSTASMTKYDFQGYTPKADVQKSDDLQRAIQGHVAARIARVKEKNFFAFPFFVRCALRLYDGSYARITAPIACYPTISRNCRFTPFKSAGEGKYQETIGVYPLPIYFIYTIFYAPLQYRITEAKRMSDWKDIVKEFVVFASDDVIPFELEGKYKFLLPGESHYMPFVNLIANPATAIGSSAFTGDYEFTNSGYKARCVLYPTYKSEQQIIDELIGKSQFFKLFSVDIGSANIVSNEDESSSTYVQPYIAPNVVSNLTSQEQLTVDDYYGWTKMIPQKIITYNGRINMIGVKRKPFDGFPFLTCAGVEQSSNNNKRHFGYYVKINATAKTCVKSTPPMSQRYSNTADSWFFYPDPNAYEVVVYDEKGKCKTIPLKRHPMLNGAYAFQRLPIQGLLKGWQAITPPTPTSPYEVLDSQIFTSVVNNPFVFQASGDNTVGTGSILGIAANTEPISQGQFGQYPLIVFTTEGIYGLSVNSEGLYSASYPISREVCNNPESITPTGNVVYFTSDKGLMAVSGGSVRCVSPQLSGANPPYSDATASFLTFVRNAFLAYDYRDSLLFIYNVSYDYAYVYNLLDGTFATISLGSKRIQRAVSNYPDTLLQDADNNVYSFSKIPVAQADTQTYSGTFTTRPLKLGSSIQLKTIHQIVHLFNSADGTLKLRVYASNDCRNWVELHSLHGKPWKYYRFSYTLSNISASDTFAGTVIDFAPRFTNKIR